MTGEDTNSCNIEGSEAKKRLFMVAQTLTHLMPELRVMFSPWFPSQTTVSSSFFFDKQPQLDKKPHQTCSSYFTSACLCACVCCVRATAVREKKAFHDCDADQKENGQFNVPSLVCFFGGVGGGVDLSDSPHIFHQLLQNPQPESASSHTELHTLQVSQVSLQVLQK